MEKKNFIDVFKFQISNFKFWNLYGLMIIQISCNFIIIWIVHQRPSNFHVIYNGSNLTVFDRLSNNYEIDNLVLRHTYVDAKQNLPS
jgi:hypothetical protein